MKILDPGENIHDKRAELSMAEELQDDRPDHCAVPKLPFMRRAWWVDRFELATKTKWKKHGDASF